MGRTTIRIARNVQTIKDVAEITRLPNRIITAVTGSAVTLAGARIRRRAASHLQRHERVARLFARARSDLKGGPRSGASPGATNGDGGKLMNPVFMQCNPKFLRRKRALGSAILANFPACVALSAMTVILGTSALPRMAMADCCPYGCCNCSCVASRAQEHANSIASRIERNMKQKGKKAQVRSFQIDVSGTESSGKWTCSPSENGAICTRQ